MSLQTILVNLATIGALRLNDAEQVAYETFRINEAARELYDCTDLVGSLREQVLNVDVTDRSSRVALPATIGRLRAVRYYYPSYDLGLVDMRPKYTSRIWQPKNWLAWRIVGEKPLSRSITNGGLFTCTFKAALTVACDVTIKGQTDTASEDSETLSFAVGDTTASTTKSFQDIVSLTKSVATNADMDIFDMDGVAMGSIPNNQLKSLYNIVQLANLPNTGMGYTPVTQYVEVLWKERFKPFVNTTDEFQCANYDQAIVWKYLAHRSSLSENMAEKANAGFYEGKVTEIIQMVERDSGLDTAKQINFGENNILTALSDLGYRGTGYQQPVGGGFLGLV